MNKWKYKDQVKVKQSKDKVIIELPVELSKIICDEVSDLDFAINNMLEIRDVYLSDIPKLEELSNTLALILGFKNKEE